ncbi:MAG: hypothetical protein KUG73_13040, partial [Pseudomonadales bacterium]|nr:hypothetical protein [Pseudomonadales bacterium]
MRRITPDIERVFCFLALILISAWSLVKYLGNNNAWKMTHWLFDYEHGFAKRSLVGAVVEWQRGAALVTSDQLLMGSYVALGSFLLIVVVFGAQAGRAKSPALWIIIALLITSP